MIQKPIPLKFIYWVIIIKFIVIAFFYCLILISIFFYTSESGFMYGFQQAMKDNFGDPTLWGSAEHGYVFATFLFAVTGDIIVFIAIRKKSMKFLRIGAILIILLTLGNKSIPILGLITIIASFNKNVINYFKINEINSP